MIDWIFDWPWALLALLIMATLTAIGLVGLSLTRRLFLHRLGRVTQLNEVTSTVLHGILIIYGLVVALLAVAVWEKHSEVKRAASAEAAAIAATYRNAGGYPEPVRAHLQAGLAAYTEYVIHEAWPLQRRGIVPEGGVEATERVQAELFAFEPATEGQRALHLVTLQSYDAFLNARRLRLDLVSAGLPGPMWAVILVGALITLASAFLFEPGSPQLHRVVVVLLSAIMGLMIFLIVFYDRPFRGRHGIGPEAFELVQEQLMKR